MISSILDVD